MWDSKEFWANNDSYDFFAMFIHHNITLLLLVSSYLDNITRIGGMTMLIHDVSDVLLEAAKMANYVKKRKLCDVVFLIFAVVFLVTRLIIFPIRCIKSLYYDSWEVLSKIGRWEYYVTLMVTMQVLHVYWSYLIFRMLSKALKKGKVSRDDRSDAESSTDDESKPYGKKKEK